MARPPVTGGTEWGLRSAVIQADVSRENICIPDKRPFEGKRQRWLWRAQRGSDGGQRPPFFPLSQGRSSPKLAEHPAPAALCSVAPLRPVHSGLVLPRQRAPDRPCSPSTGKCARAHHETSLILAGPFRQRLTANSPPPGAGQIRAVRSSVSRAHASSRTRGEAPEVTKSVASVA